MNGRDGTDPRAGSRFAARSNADLSARGGFAAELPLYSLNLEEHFERYQGSLSLVPP